MNHGTRVGIFDDANMGVAIFLVRHGLTIFAARTVLFPTGFEEFIGVPLIIFGDPIAPVVCALPEHHPDRRLVEPYYDI